jgi:hypothetical protein
MPRVAVKTGLAQALAFGMLLFLSPLDAKSLRGTDNRILPAEDKAITTTTAPEEDKGVITNSLVGAGVPAAKDRAVMIEPQVDKSEESDAVVAIGAAYASAIGGAIGDAVATGGGNIRARRRSPGANEDPEPTCRLRVLRPPCCIMHQRPEKHLIVEHRRSSCAACPSKLVWLASPQLAVESRLHRHCVDSGASKLIPARATIRYEQSAMPSKPVSHQSIPVRPPLWGGAASHALPSASSTATCSVAAGQPAGAPPLEVTQNVSLQATVAARPWIRQTHAVRPITWNCRLSLSLRAEVLAGWKSEAISEDTHVSRVKVAPSSMPGHPSQAVGS